MSGWEVRFSNSRKLPYYYNQATKESTWEVPAGMSSEQVMALPGAHILSGDGGAAEAPNGDKVRASHILAKHTGSRRPSSWKQVSLQVSKNTDASRQISPGLCPKHVPRSRRTLTACRAFLQTSSPRSLPLSRRPRVTALARRRAATSVGLVAV